MTDFQIRSDNVDVEQIMRQIRARIREKRGVDYTEEQVQELATVRLEKFLDPKNLRSDLLERRWVRLHVTLIGLVTFASLWGLAHALMRTGVDSMALRHGLALIGAYLIYLGLLWLWARWLLSREESCDGLDLVDLPK